MSDRELFRYLPPKYDRQGEGLVYPLPEKCTASKYQYKLLEWLENKAIIIHFERGSAGNLVHRVLGSHDPIYWSYEINNSYEKENNPIKWPKHGYIEIHIDQGCTCHTGHSFIEEAHENRIHDRIFRNSEILKAMKQNKTFVLLTHVDIRTLNRNIRVLRIVGDENKLKRNHLYKTHVPKQFHKPIIEDNTYNLNINNLVDENYDIFEKEYLALCNQYKFTPNTKPVRDFILVWRNKQDFSNI